MDISAGLPVADDEYGVNVKGGAKMIDNHPLQLKGLELYKQGNLAEAEECEEAFLREVFSSGKDHCPCTVACQIHGDCRACVTSHRGHGDHLPNCLQAMVNKKIEALSAITEHSFTPPR